ncbi:hypothetical protein OPV22_013739 [Ensete ventricosum]|uniref:Uncharacterized protein n=1 Tax=Ensete ventricosum TaxID=4639 RepID=A0AAV8R1N4_ENSVE|nr:hypothetical protein OPV22_013739 [Ensete ventricosum]
MAVKHLSSCAQVGIDLLIGAAAVAAAGEPSQAELSKRFAFLSSCCRCRGHRPCPLPREKLIAEDFSVRRPYKVDGRCYRSGHRTAEVEESGLWRNADRSPSSWFFHTLAHYKSALRAAFFTLHGLLFVLLLGLLLFISVVCPYWLIRIQEYKFEINGPWDEAKLCFDITEYVVRDVYLIRFMVERAKVDSDVDFNFCGLVD